MMKEQKKVNVNYIYRCQGKDIVMIIGILVKHKSVVNHQEAISNKKENQIGICL